MAGWMICLLLLLPGQENHQTDGSSEITPFAIRYVGEVTNNYCRAGFKSLLRCCNACRRECKGVSFVKPNCCLYNELSMRSFSINPSEQSSNAIYVECYNIATGGADYTGTVSETFNGYQCQRWDTSNEPHDYFNLVEFGYFPDSTVSKAENFCRNPDNTPEGPWCYTTNPNKRWEFCGIPQCS